MAKKIIVLDVQNLLMYSASIQTMRNELEQYVSELFVLFESVRANIATLTTLTYNQKKNWMDPQFDLLQLQIEQCIYAVNSTSFLLQETSLTVSTKLSEIEQSIAYINKLVKQLKEINFGSGSIGVTSGYKKHLSTVEVSSKWEAAVQSINEQIANYREALNQRGVPNCKWLDCTLATHKAAMLEREAYELDVASGHSETSTHNSESYHYPRDYNSFYNQLAGEFRTYCATNTNPNYNSQQVNEWYVNCQRCVPTYEMLRRGFDVTALPYTNDYDYLSSHPYSVWENVEVISCTGEDRTEIENAMSSWGDGARAQIVVMWTQFSGHTFIAEQRNGETVYIDPQSGNENYTDWIDSAIPGRTQFCRIDNINTTDLINRCCREAG